MSSILDSAKLVFTDNNALTKIAVLSLIPFVVYNIVSKTFVISAIDSVNMQIIGVLGLIYYGYMLKTLNNSILEKNYVLSGLNPFSAFWAGLKGLVPTFIFSVPIYIVYVKIFPLLQDYSGLSSIILKTIACIIPASFLFMSIILYAKNMNPFSGLNIIKIAKNFHEIIVYLAFSIVLLALFNIVTMLPVGAIIYGLFGEGRIFEYAISIILTSNLLLYFQNLSHAYFEQVKE